MKKPTSFEYDFHPLVAFWKRRPIAYLDASPKEIKIPSKPANADIEPKISEILWKDYSNVKFESTIHHIIGSIVTVLVSDSWTKLQIEQMSETFLTMRVSERTISNSLRQVWKIWI